MKELIAKIQAWFARPPEPRSDAAVVTDPRADHSEAERLCGEGARLLDANRLADAVSLLEQAIERAPESADAHFFLGVAQKRLGKIDEARDSLLLATCFKPSFANAFFYLGVCAVSVANDAEAKNYFRQTLDADPDHANAHNALGTLYVRRNEFDAAEAAFSAAMRADPGHLQARSNLGCLLIAELDRADEGTALLASALQGAPDNDDVLRNWTMGLLHRGELGQAIALCDRLLERNPGLAKVRLNRALALLKRREYARGWADYEARTDTDSSHAQELHGPPQWLGEPLAGRTILLHAEQGLGDQIMFASCVPEIAAAAGKCVLECDPRLEKIFRRSFPGVIVSSRRSTVEMLAAQNVSEPDYQLSLGSVPRYCRNSVGDFPQHSGYLSADVARVDYWRQRLAALPSGRKIAVSWRGGTRASRGSMRSLPLDTLLPVLSRANANFISLQYTDCSSELIALERDHGVRLQHWPEAIVDYDETAALVAAVDLVISVTTSVVHLAGALHKPVWILAPAVAEWPFGENGDSMDWYPSAKIFRQPSPGDWKTVVDRVAAELEAFEPVTER